jgi:hypothetical protein
MQLKYNRLPFVIVIAVCCFSACKKPDSFTGYTVNCTFTERITGLPFANEEIKLSHVTYDFFGTPTGNHIASAFADQSGHVHFDVSASIVPTGDFELIVPENDWRCAAGFYVDGIKNSESEFENYRNVGPVSVVAASLHNSGLTNPLDSLILYGGCVGPYIVLIKSGTVDTTVYANIEGEMTQNFTLEVHGNGPTSFVYQSAFITGGDTTEVIINY